MYVYVHVHVFTHVCTHVCTLHVYVCTCMYVVFTTYLQCMYMYVWMYIHLCMYLPYTYLQCMYVCMYLPYTYRYNVCMYICIYHVCTSASLKTFWRVNEDSKSRRLCKLESVIPQTNWSQNISFSVSPNSQNSESCLNWAMKVAIETWVSTKSKISFLCFRSRSVW